MQPRLPNRTASFVYRDTDPYSTPPRNAADVRAPSAAGGTLARPKRAYGAPVTATRSSFSAIRSPHFKQQQKGVGQPQQQRKALGDRSNNLSTAVNNHSKPSLMDWDYTPSSSVPTTRLQQQDMSFTDYVVAAAAAAATTTSGSVSRPVLGESLQHTPTVSAAATERALLLSSSIATRAMPMSSVSSTFDPFGPYDLFGLHTASLPAVSTEVDAATPHLHITNIPLAMDSREIVDILKGNGEIKKVYESLLHLEGKLTISYYDVRHAVIAHQTLQPRVASQPHGIQVGFMDDALLSIRYNVCFEDSRASATLMLTMLGSRDRLMSFDYKELLRRWGDIRTDVQLELSEYRRTVQIEYFDQRCVPLVIASMHEQYFMNIHFHVSRSTVVAGGGIVSRCETLESTLNTASLYAGILAGNVSDRGADIQVDNTSTALSTPSSSLILPFEPYPPLLHQQTPRLLSHHSSSLSSTIPQCQTLYFHTTSPPGGVITPSSLPAANAAAASIPASSLYIKAARPKRDHNNRSARMYANSMTEASSSNSAHPRTPSDPESNGTLSSEDDERMASSSSTFTLFTATSLSPRDEQPTWTPPPPPPRLSGTDNSFNLERIMDGKDTRTTFMIRNIPNKYTQAMLRECIDATNKGTYDFLYLRIDFQNRCNVGYAFINFIDVKSVTLFARERVGKRWNRFNSEKRCSLSYANIQGKKALMEKFRNSTVMEEDESYRPKIFYSDGPMKGEEEPFPPPTVQGESRRHNRADGRRRRGAD